MPRSACAYLRRDATPATAARWNQVLAALGTHTPVGQALTSPLLVALARTIYNPRPGEQAAALPNPAELCDQDRFPSLDAVRERLFDAFIPAAYRPHPNPRRQSRWTADQAGRWLGFLARHPHHDPNATTDIAWWQLHHAIPPLLPRLAAGLMGGLAGGLVVGLWGVLVAGLVAGLAAGPVFGLLGRVWNANGSGYDQRHRSDPTSLSLVSAGVRGGSATPRS